VATLMVLFRVLAWSRSTTFVSCSLVSALRAVERRDADAVARLTGVRPRTVLQAAAAARFCLRVCR